MKNRVAITGMGIISSIGLTVEENFQSLLSKKHGISTIDFIETVHKKEILVGEIKTSNETLQHLLNLPENNTFTRTGLLGAYAAKQAIQNANILDVNEVRTGFISSTSVAGMDFTEKHYKQYEQHPEYTKYIESHNAGDTSNKIAEYLGVKGFVTTISHS